MKIVSKGTNFSTFLSRRRSSSSTSATTRELPRFRCTNEVPQRYKSFVVEEAQNVLREYLHATKSLPFAFSELIAKNSPFSLSNLVKNIRFSVPNFSRSLRTLLRYEPINEFEFFYESIGIGYQNVGRYLPRNKFFFSDDRPVIDSAFALARFGFPWNSLGKLYEDETLIFRKSDRDLTFVLLAYKEYLGVENLPVVGICLAFPRLLTLEGEGDLGGNVEAILDCLKRVFVEFDVESCVEGNVDAWYELCCKVRVFTDLDCEIEKVGELMCAKKDIFLRSPRDVLVKKVEYFSNLGVSKVDVGLLLLHSPEILDLDLESPAISVLRVLEHFGLDEDRLRCVNQKYSHVLGRNEMANLPCVMKALDLSEWFFNRVNSSGLQLLATCAVSCPEEDLDKEFMDAMSRIKSLRCPRPSLRKVVFLKKIGFGENATTIKVIKHIKGTCDQLLKRFDCFLHMGIEYSRVCLLIRMAPQILTQSPENVQLKLKFLREDIGLSFEYLDSFPAFVCHDLDRIKYRYRFYAWLRKNELLKKSYCIATMIATSEKQLVARLSAIHPAVPKQYLERFSRRIFISDDCQEQSSLD